MAKQFEEKAIKLMNGCIRPYLFNPRTGLAPEQFVHSTSGILELNFGMIDSNFNLRPETVESLYYMYRYTGNELYREIIWLLVSSVEYYCKTRYGFTNIRDVIVNEKADRQETFFFSELMKYAYLAFEEGADMPIDPHGVIKPPKGINMPYNEIKYPAGQGPDVIGTVFDKHKLHDLTKYIFNTEGHPIRVRTWNIDLENIDIYL